MSATSELHHDQISEPEPRWTSGEFENLVEVGATGAWKNSNERTSFGELCFLVRAAFRAALPDRVPEEIF